MPYAFTINNHNIKSTELTQATPNQTPDEIFDFTVTVSTYKADHNGGRNHLT